MLKQTEGIDIELIRKRVLSKLTPEEEVRFQRWLTKKANRDYYEKAQYYYTKGRVRNASEIDTKQVWSILIHRLQPQRSRLLKHPVMVAASIAAVIAVSALLLILLEQPADNVKLAKQITSIVPGHRSAELILSNGQKVRLGNEKQEVVEENGTVINLGDEEVIYKSDEDISGYDLKNTIRVGRGEEFSLVLADGTKVWINSLSELSFPVNFNESVREVEILSGEACFDVAHDQQRPFIVKTPGHNIKVLGTTFNVSCYQNENVIETTLIEGLIEINNQQGASIPVIIRPDQQYVFSKNTLDSNVQRVNGANYIAWTQGVFLFEDESLESIFKTLERWYNINVFFETNEKRAQIFSGRLPRFENVDVILNMIEKVSDVEFNLQDNTVIIK